MQRRDSGSGRRILSSARGIAVCPRCDRTVATTNNRFALHSITVGTENRCPLSWQHTPFVGETPHAYIGRAHLVTDLAEQVQDADPALVWEYVTALPSGEVQRLLMIAFAAVPVDRKVEDIFGWVCELPIAKAATA